MMTRLMQIYNRMCIYLNTEKINAQELKLLGENTLDGMFFL